MSRLGGCLLGKGVARNLRYAGSRRGALAFAVEALASQSLQSDLGASVTYTCVGDSFEVKLATATSQEKHDKALSKPLFFFEGGVGLGWVLGGCEVVVRWNASVDGPWPDEIVHPHETTLA